MVLKPSDASAWGIVATNPYFLVTWACETFYWRKASIWVAVGPGEASEALSSSFLALNLPSTISVEMMTGD